MKSNISAYTETEFMADRVQEKAGSKIRISLRESKPWG